VILKDADSDKFLANVRSAVHVSMGEAGVTFAKHLRLLRKNLLICITNACK